ncbi:diguanylate cyclase, partial [Candidatus Auribacterota bacterium]
FIESASFKLPKLSLRNFKMDVHKFIRYLFHPSIGCIIICLIVILNLPFNFTHKFELDWLDQLFKLKGKEKISDQIIAIDMDEKSMSYFGVWPWSRDIHAYLVQILTKYEAKNICFDIFFCDPFPLVDLFLMNSIKKNKNIFLAIGLQLIDEKVQEIDPAVLNFTFNPPSMKGKKDNSMVNTVSLGHVKEIYHYIKGAGHVIATPDEDGIIRRVPAMVKAGDTFFPHLALPIIADFFDGKKEDIDIDLESKQVRIKGKKKTIQIPLDKEGNILINWAGKWRETFKHVSYVDIILSSELIKQGKKPIIPLEQFKDKICIVGLTAAGLLEIKATPIEPSYPMVGLHENILNSSLTNSWISYGSLNLMRVILGIVAIIICLQYLLKISLVIDTIVALSLGIIYLIFNIVLFSVYHLYIPIWSFYLFLFSVFLYGFCYRILEIWWEKNRFYTLGIKDGLTGLYNIRHFKELFSEQMKFFKQKRGHNVSVLMFDIDHFKMINDTYGHQAGDAILKNLAKFLGENVRGQDVCARYGGEEFIVMLPHTNVRGAEKVAEVLRKGVEKIQTVFNDKEIRITVSIGASDSTMGDDIDSLIKAADGALYYSKENGRNRVTAADHIEKKQNEIDEFLDKR